LTAATAAAGTEASRRWLLLAPALLILAVGAVGPLVIVVIYSFLTPGDYAGVKWIFSGEAWINLFLQQDIFDDTWQWADAHLSIFWRTLLLSVGTTLATLVLGFPTAWYIATRPKRSRSFWLFLVTVPFWCNLLVRTFAIMQLIRNEGVVNNVLLGLGLIEQPIQMLYTDFAVGLGMAYVYLPLMVLPLYASIEKLDFRLIEAAYDLYADRRQALIRVVLPLVRPGLVAGSILVFIPALGAYVVPRMLGGGNRMMIGNLIDLQFGQGRNWPLGASLALLLMLIVLAALTLYVRQVGRGDARHG
jgi:spermidine/putrescine transport system permease protein